MKLEGYKELLGQLENLGAELGVKTLRTAGRKAFWPVLEAARARAPVDTGVLRDSIKLVTRRPKTGAVVQVGLRIVYNKASKGDIRRDASWRWPFVEFGTLHSPAKPFLRPALDGNKQRVVDGLKPELQKAINRRLRKLAKRARRR